MELLLPAIITVLAEIFKRMFEVIQNKELAKSIVILFVFLSSIAGVYLFNWIGGETISFEREQVIETVLMAVGYYELALKRVVIPAINKSKKIKLD